MTPERHRQIKRLFLAAVELGPDELAPFLDRECAGDDELAGEVRSLIDHHVTETLLEAAGTPGTLDGLGTALSIEAAWPKRAAALDRQCRPAGTIVASRYRLLVPLGRGGMGVVYRAEDLELDQNVALKFLSPELEKQPRAMELMRREVRIARQITHRNIVRIFDVGTADGQTFISMEFVAGEDLESLVRRVGPLPPAKVFQIARQLAAGLAAAHDAGILHRDLKPANVMIDGAGEVRILDFGIAAPLDDEEALKRISGTPGFIPPELLRGEKASHESDLYAWGVVIYYATTGKLPALAPAEEDGIGLLRAAGIDAELSECVEACLQPDPAMRPRSAHDLIVALLGGNPLEQSVRAGRMPSADVLAASVVWRPSAWLLNVLLAAGLLVLGLIWLLADRTLFLPRAGLIKSPVVLSEIAEQLLVKYGHQEPRGPAMTGVSVDTACLQYVRAHPEIPEAWRKVASGKIPAVSFWYRSGDTDLPRPGLLRDEQPEERQLRPGSARVRLDGRGNLLSLEIDQQGPGDPGKREPVEWPKLFELAGLSWEEFHSAEPRQWPPHYADAVHGWSGPFPADGRVNVQVNAASLGGRIVYFDVAQPWDERAIRAAGARRNTPSSLYATVRAVLWLTAIVLAAALAWRHGVAGHADWRGAWRVTASVLGLGTLDWLCGSRHNFILPDEVAAAADWLSAIVSSGVIAGVAYLAVEPAARKWWPWSVITLRRLLDGRFRDERIWADGLVGIVTGLGCVLLRQLCTLVNQGLGIPVSGLNDFDPGQNLLDHFGLRYKIAVLVTALLLAVLESLLVLTLVVALRRLTKSTLAAAALLVLILAALAIVGRGIVSPIDWLARTLLLSIAAWALLRCGLLATITALTTFYAIHNAPLTLDWSRWYALTGLVVAATVAVALLGCWHLARPRQIARGRRGPLK